MSDDQLKDTVNLMEQTVKREGVACASVKDGHILWFRRDKLQQVLDQHPNQEEIVIFVKRPEAN